MKILITSGGTSEKIDEVRKISNMATGRLGALTADEFMKNENAEITYVCGAGAAVPSNPAAEIIRIAGVGGLAEALTGLFARNKFAAVIHSMAVSDYTVRGAVSAGELSSAAAKTVYENRHLCTEPEILAGIINDAILQSVKSTPPDKKISSNIDGLMIFMDKAPKVISMIKRLQPDTVLVGFKLQAGVSREVLLQTGYELLVKNNCDFVLANDLERIREDSHEGMLIKPDRSYKLLRSKREIAEAVAGGVLRLIKERDC